MNHDIEAALADFMPAVHPPRLEGADVNYVLEDTVVGRLLLAAGPGGTLLSCGYVPDDATAGHLLDRLARVVSPRVLRGGRALEPARRELGEYLDGRRKAFDLDVDLALATPFQRVVLDRLARSVAYGRTMSYGELAREIGRPSASRAVGAALGANPLCVVLPCHRVVAASGALTGYAGGLDAKRLLLDLEASQPV
jgi:methylated-DNA-[protein]-cysteine S-methyltransferase